MNTCITEAAVESSKCKELQGIFMKNHFFYSGKKAESCRKKSTAIVCGTCRLRAGLNLQSIHTSAGRESRHQAGKHSTGNQTDDNIQDSKKAERGENLPSFGGSSKEGGE
jgi:hypothetical protein